MNPIDHASEEGWLCTRQKGGCHVRNPWTTRTCACGAWRCSAKRARRICDELNGKGEGACRRCSSARKSPGSHPISATLKGSDRPNPGSRQVLATAEDNEAEPELFGQVVTNL